MCRFSIDLCQKYKENKVAAFVDTKVAYEIIYQQQEKQYNKRIRKSYQKCSDNHET